MRGSPEEENERGAQRRGQVYPLSCLDRVVCPSQSMNMLFFFDATLDPPQLEAALRRVVTKHPFVAGTFRGWLRGARVVCDDHGVEFTVAESTWALRDIRHDSPALARLSRSGPCGFGPGECIPDDCCVCMCSYAPGNPPLSHTRMHHQHKNVPTEIRQADGPVEGHLLQGPRRPRPPDAAQGRRLVRLAQRGTCELWGALVINTRSSPPPALSLPTYMPKTPQSHMVMDAKSIMKLLELWAREARGDTALSDNEVLLGPSVLDGIGA